MTANHPIDYVERVNRVLDHVQQHLEQPLRLEELAKVACFSPYHFHRIFQSVTGETLAAFIKRVRLERALSLLSHQPQTSLTQIALSCGFSSSSDFSRSFKKQYGVPPRNFDAQAFRQQNAHRLNRLQYAAPLEEQPPPGGKLPASLPPASPPLEEANPSQFAIQLLPLPARSVAYFRVPRPYQDSSAVLSGANRLLEWAKQQALEDSQWLGYQWEDPEVVDLDKCRYDIGVVVPPQTRVGGEIGMIHFPAMTVASIAICGGIQLEIQALEWLFSTWLPSSGHAPAHQPCFEAWNGLPFEHGTEHFELQLQLPLESEQ